MQSSSNVPEGIGSQTLTLFYRDSIQLMRQALSEDEAWFETKISELLERHLRDAGNLLNENNLQKARAVTAPVIEPLALFLKEQKMKEKNRLPCPTLFAKVIHDIRSPIAALKTVLSVPASLDPRRMDIINSITERIDRIARDLDSPRPLQPH